MVTIDIGAHETGWGGWKYMLLRSSAGSKIYIYISNLCDAFTSDIPAKTICCPMFAFKGISSYAGLWTTYRSIWDPTINGSGNFGDTSEVGVSQNSDHDFETMRTVRRWLAGLGGWWRGLKKYLPYRIDAWKRAFLEATSYKLVFWECRNKIENNSNYI